MTLPWRGMLLAAAGKYMQEAKEHCGRTQAPLGGAGKELHGNDFLKRDPKDVE